MNTLESYLIASTISFVVALVATPLVKRLAIKIGATDKPDYRKVHSKLMPRLGGLAIVIGMALGLLFLRPNSLYFLPIVIGALIIITIGVLDDKFVLPARIKFFGQLLAALVPVLAGMNIDHVGLPFGGDLQLGIFAYPVTILWIIGITNAINLMDGLDGLAGGVSVIGLSTILVMAVVDQQFFIMSMAAVLIGSIIGFLIHNFHPAKIFMGDTGALFLGYMIAVLSVLGFFKSLATFSLLIPILILAVPIFDTLFAIIRRIMKGQKISAPDKSHLHHCLLALGFSHRVTVIIIYSLSAVFGLTAIVFSNSTLWGSLVIFILALMVTQITAEIIGVFGDKNRLMINGMKKLVSVTQAIKNNR